MGSTTEALALFLVWYEGRYNKRGMCLMWWGNREQLTTVGQGFPGLFIENIILELRRRLRFQYSGQSQTQKPEKACSAGDLPKLPVYRQFGRYENTKLPQSGSLRAMSGNDLRV